MDTGDDPLWLHCHQMFSEYLLPGKHMGLTVGERGGKLTHYLGQSKKNRHGQSFPTILIVYIWVLILPLFSNALLGFLTSLSKITLVTSCSRRFLNSIRLFSSGVFKEKQTGVSVIFLTLTYGWPSKTQYLWLCGHAIIFYKLRVQLWS